MAVHVTPLAKGGSCIKQTSDFKAISHHIDLLVALHLHLWNNLTYAIQNAWGGSPQICDDKRDWLAGAISDLITPDPETLRSDVTNKEDLEDVLVQVMLDEFEVVVDDGSCKEVAEAIWQGRDKIIQGDFGEVQELKKRWDATKDRKLVFQEGEQDEAAQDTDEDADDRSSTNDREWNGFLDNDTEMDEASSLVETKHSKPEPEVDEEGFTKVVRKKR